MRSTLEHFQRASTPIVEEKDQAWYLAELMKVCSDIREDNNNFKIICPFHADSSPSCDVHKTEGYFHCFSCNAGGHWNKLAAKLGMEKRSAREGPKDEVRTRIVHALKKAGVNPVKKEKKGEFNQPLVTAWPVEKEWRGLSGEFLASIGCVRVTDLVRSTLRIGMPVRTPDGALTGYTARVIEPADASPKYIPLSADRKKWRDKEIPAKTAVFLIDQAEEWRHVVLVEGPYDALRLFHAGIPALSILGAEMWGPEKRAIVCGLPALEKVFVLLDSDAAGRRGQKSILASLRGYIPAVGLRLPEGVKDPGDLEKEEIEWLRSKVGSV